MSLSPYMGMCVWCWSPCMEMVMAFSSVSALNTINGNVSMSIFGSLGK